QVSEVEVGFRAHEVIRVDRDHADTSSMSGSRHVLSNSGGWGPYSRNRTSNLPSGCVGTQLDSPTPGGAGPKSTSTDPSALGCTAWSLEAQLSRGWSRRKA